MDSLEKFLNKNQPKNNQNQKFVDSSPTSSVFGRLGYNFTPSNPSILELSDAAKKHLAKMPKLIKDWQAEDMRNGTVVRTNYFKNPVYNIATSLKANLQKIIDAIPIRQYTPDEWGWAPTQTVSAIPELTPIYDSANVAATEIVKFIEHTDRISNVVEIKPDTSDLPHYEQAMAVGRQLLYIVNQTDNIQNNAPILGTFTSIFVEPELKTLNTDITPFAAEIANSITTTIIDFEGGYTITTNLSSQRIETITNKIKEVKNFIEGRRKHDENFWTKAKTIVEEYQQFKTLSSGETQDKLIDGYIGTDELKQKKQIKDVPVEPSYNVTVAYNGTITYKSRKEGVNTIVVPTIVVRTTPISGTLTYYEELPTTDNVVGDTYYITTTGETWRWNGSSWILISKQDPISPTITLEEYINYYSNHSLNVAFSGYELRLSPAAIIFDTDNGLWASNASITITNTGANDFTYTSVSASNFLNAEIRYAFNPNNDTTINVGESVVFNVSARSLQEGNTVDYGVISISPGVSIKTKLISNTASYGILLPSDISYNVGTSTNRLPINVVSGPIPILSASSEFPDLWTWKNQSKDSVTISSIVDVTDSNSANDMTITFYQANTPNTLNVNDSVLWYANVTPKVEFPNTHTFKITTTDGQERLMKLGIDPGNVDDSNLYIEIVNSSPDIIVTNANFDLRVFGGKPNTVVNISGPNSSNVKVLDANGKTILANNSITSNGTYTWVFDFVGTGHRRTITKAIFS